MQASTRSGGHFGIDPDDVHDQYDRAGFGNLSDAQLFDRAAAIVSVPRHEEANSFVLHAPLELMARRLLMPLVPPGLRRAAPPRGLWGAPPPDFAGGPAGVSSGPPPATSEPGIRSSRRARSPTRHAVPHGRRCWRHSP